MYPTKEDVKYRLKNLDKQMNALIKERDKIDQLIKRIMLEVEILEKLDEFYVLESKK